MTVQNFTDNPLRTVVRATVRLIAVAMPFLAMWMTTQIFGDWSQQAMLAGHQTLSAVIALLGFIVYLVVGLFAAVALLLGVVSAISALDRLALATR